MSVRRILAIAKKNLLAFRRDRRTLGFVVFVPLLIIVLFGYTFGSEIRDIEVVVVNHDEAVSGRSVAASMIAKVSDAGALKLVSADGTALDAEQVALDRVRHGDVWGLIVFERGFSADVATSVSALKQGQLRMPASFRVYVDATNPMILQTVERELMVAIQSVLGGSGVITPIMPATERVYGQNAKFIDFSAPGIMSFAALIITFMLSIISFVHEKGTGTLDRLLTTPATEGEIVAGYALAFGLLALIQSSIILTTAVLLFQVGVVGNVFLALLVLVLLAIGSQALGFLFSSIAKNEFQAIQFVPVMFVPSILLAGVFWPLESIPEVLRPLSYFIPLTYAVNGTRSVMVRGWGPGEIWVELTVLAGFAVAMLLLSTLALKRRA